jgi:hypothetical protein
MKVFLLVVALGAAGSARGSSAPAQRATAGRAAAASAKSDAAPKAAAPAMVQDGGRPEAGAAAPPPARAPARRSKIAILDVRSSGNLDVKEVSGLTGLIAAEAERFELQVVAGADLSALVGFERQKQLLGCADGGCLAEIGGALGVGTLLSAEVSRVGSVWLLSMTLLDLGNARAVKRTTRRAVDMSGLVTAAAEATQELLAAIAPRREAQSGAAPEASARSERPPEVAVRAPEATKSSRRKILAYALGGTGIAALGGGVAFGLAAKSSYDQALRASQAASASRSEVLSLRDRTARQMWIADGFYAAGAAALGVGLYLAFAGEAEPAQKSLAFAPAPGGGLLTITGGF